MADGSVNISPQVAEGHVLFGCDSAFFYAVDIYTGKQKWRTSISKGVSSFLYIDGVLYYGSPQAFSAMKVNLEKM